MGPEHARSGPVTIESCYFSDCRRMATMLPPVYAGTATGSPFTSRMLGRKMVNRPRNGR